MRTLILMRHAKSDYPAGVPDRERPLSSRGERDALAASAWLRSAFPVIDEVVLSPAMRARQTWAVLEPSLGARSMRIDPRVYEEWGAHLPAVLADMDPMSRTAMIVGHNPGVEEFALALCRGDGPACERIRDKFPTAGIAVISMRGEWRDQSSAEVALFAVPRASG